MSAGTLPRGARLRSFYGLGPRSLRARPLRSVLTAGGIVLGVGMAFGVLILVSTIHSTFNQLYGAIYGNASLVVSGKASIGSLPESSLAQIRGVDGVKAAAGDIYGQMRLVDEQGRAEKGRSSMLFVEGRDFAGPNTTTAETVEGREPTSGRQIELEQGWAEDHGLAPGDRVRLATAAGYATLAVTGLYRFEGGLDLGGYGTAAMPIAAARELMDKHGTWDEITVVVDDDASEGAVRRGIEAVTGAGVEVSTPEAKGDEANEALSGLDIVLYFFSGMAVFVGAFLILNSFNMTVLQRIREIGTLRALGASRRRIVVSVVGEALLLAAVGSAFGLGLGLGLAYLLAEAMRSLFGLPVSDLDVTAGSMIAAIVVGILATVAGSLYPALRAGRISPIRALTGGASVERRPGLVRGLVGLALFFPGLALGGLYWFSTETGGFLAALVGVGSTMVMFVGMVLLAPFVILPLIRLLARPTRAVMPAEGRLATDSLRSNPLRTSATAATLVVALSVVVVNATMASSFVGSISNELDKRFARDLTVQPIGFSEYGGPAGTIAGSVQRRIAALPEAGTVTPRRTVFMRELPGGESQGLLVAVDPAAWPRVDRSEYEGGSTRQVMAGLAAGGVVVGKGYSDDANLEVGDRVLLKGASGTRRAPVVGILDTFEASGNEVMVSLSTIERVYGIKNDSQLAVVAKPGASSRALAAKVGRLIEADYPSLEAVSNVEVKENYENEVNQQFAFFNAIIGIAVIVGLLGIINTLSMSVIERTREIGVLRALGGSRWRVRRMMLDESLLISTAGALTGIAAGLLVAVVWLFAVREASLVGLEIHFPVATLVTIAVLGVVLGALAAILPARRAARLDPLQALTYE